MTHPLPTNTPCVLTGIVDLCEPRQGSDAHDLVITYMIERGRENVESAASFYCGKYYAATCASLQKGMRIAVEFNVSCKPRQTGAGYFVNLDVRKIRVLEHVQQTPKAGAGSERLDYSNRDEAPW